MFVRVSLCAQGKNPGYPLGGAPKVLGENKKKTKSEIKQVSFINLKLCPCINEAQTGAHINNDSYLHSLCIKCWPGLLCI